MVQSLEESLGEVPDESVVLSSLITLNYQKKRRQSDCFSK